MSDASHALILSSEPSQSYLAFFIRQGSIISKYQHNPFGKVCLMSLYTEASVRGYSNQIIKVS